MRDKGSYVLATGDAAAHRLNLLHRTYGPAGRELLLRAGIQPGMRVADLGCGVGKMTQLLAELVGPGGEVIGVDFSPEQVEHARTSLSDLTHVRFLETSATDTKLERESFDLVYSRFLLIHLKDPNVALREMYDLLKPEGIFVCEDGDLTSADSEPSSKLKEFSNLFGGLGPCWGVDYSLGRRLMHLVMDANFKDPEITFNQPVFARGENKRLFDLSVAEAGPSFIQAGLITETELEELLIEMRRLADDESVVAIFPRMTQIWARKT